MNKDEFIETIKDIKVNAPNEEFFLEYNKTVYDILNEKENLIKFIEDKIKKLKDECAKLGHLIDRDSLHKYDLQIKLCEDLLERIKNNNYEN